MAQRVYTQLVSDLSGKELGEGEGKTVKFGYNGVDYTIDLTDQEAEKFDKAMGTYISSGTRVGGRRSTGSGRSASRGGDARKIRDWANTNGFQVGDRGRIPEEVRQAYNAAN